VRIVLLGDSHLARVRRDLDRLTGADAPMRVVNAAVGGAFTSDLVAQAVGTEVAAEDRVAVSVGTNDAAPWKQLPLAEAVDNVTSFVTDFRPTRLVYLSPPGVDEQRLAGPNDRAVSLMAAYGEAISQVFLAAGATVVDAAALLAPLGPRAFVGDGMHLSGAAYDVVLPALREALQASDDG
jgi:lysophospholipase L1-like esterase